MKKNELGPDLIKKIGIALGREVSPSEEGNVSTFTEFTDLDVSEFRTLEQKSGVLAVSYIRFRLRGNVILDKVVSYYATVVQQRVPVEDWIDDAK